MRTLDDIIPPSRRKETESLSRPAGRGPLHSPDRPSKFPYATLGAIVLVIAVSVGALFYFSTASVEVTPNTVSAAVQSSFTANQSTGALPYEIVVSEKIASQSVKSSGTKTVNSSASGTLTIYNTQSKSQTLIANTRFATTAGLIFRIRTAVTVPSGSTAKPGSLTVKVYADKAGEAYNVGPTSFTIPGFAGTPQASQVYARSTSAMTGGASGSVPIVDAAVETAARTALKKALAPDLATSLEAQVPAGYILLPGAAVTTFQELTSAPSSTTGQVEVKEQGTITAVVFPNAALAKAIATSVGGLGYQGEPLTLASAAELKLSATSGLPEPDAASFSFTLSGTAPLIYTVDPTRIAAAVSGKTRSAAEVALTNYPEVKRAVIILRPFWRQMFPQDPASIDVIVANQ
ncbi:MAG: hypothetical protein WC814_01785 [Candidatus Paceibacterota bacterium]|jgi:hypothetical protein